jgi:hypothetical protein
MNKVNNKKDDLITQEWKELEAEKKKTAFTTDIKKRSFAEEIKNNIGNVLKADISNPDRHNPKKQGFWNKLIKAIGF